LLPQAAAAKQGSTHESRGQLRIARTVAFGVLDVLAVQFWFIVLRMSVNGGAVIGEALVDAGVSCLFTLCGGHISPILVSAKRRGIRVIDMRGEVSAVFAADAVARLTGGLGVAAVTAGPGVTNAVTAVKNAQMAQSPLLLLGGATATILKGRGSLQDIDQLALMSPITKWATSVRTYAALEPTLRHAIEVARSGVPGPVFIEVPVDLLYDQEMVQTWYLREAGVEKASSLGARALRLFLKGHLYRQFHAPALPIDFPFPELRFPALLRSEEDRIAEAAALLRTSERPVLVVGSQALVNCRDPGPLAAAVRGLGVPVFLGGMARGLLGRESEVQFRHARGRALAEADLVLVAGFPFDFRLGYGRAISRGARVVAANLSGAELRKNRRPRIAVEMHPGDFLRRLAELAPARPQGRAAWFQVVRDRERKRDQEVAKMAEERGERVNPLELLLRIEERMDANSLIAVDGGDFAATAAYTLRPRAPLSWLDPGVFGTLGVGGGFAVGAAAVRPTSEIWLIYGDGSCAYSLAEFDTCVRHGLAPIAVVGNDGSWAQIAREQSEMLGDDIGTVLARTDYHKVAEGYGGTGLLVTRPEEIDDALDRAKTSARQGRPVCINVHLDKTQFRKGSISM
jgi:acetolactate synthase-1/2/3 large subunit